VLSRTKVWLERSRTRLTSVDVISPDIFPDRVRTNSLFRAGPVEPLMDPKIENVSNA